MSDEREYLEGDHSDFIQYLFGSGPKPPHSIALESPPLDLSKNAGLHIFEQLLMIFVDGLKHLYGDQNDKVNLNELSLEDIAMVTLYFHSIAYDITVDLFETMYDYQFKYPNYFKDQSHITDSVVLSDFYYEVFGHNNRVFRITFRSLDPT